MSLKKIISILIFMDLLVMILVFAVSGFYNDRIDTNTYTSQIEQFESKTLVQADADVALRSFKPLYGIIGSWIVPFLSPYNAILSINILFLIGLTIVSFFFFKEFSLDSKFSIIGAIWVATGYPMIKYGLALGTDISGWFFSVATALAVLVGIRKESPRLIVLASLIGFLGVLTKETGALGLLFGGLYILSFIGFWNIRKIIKFLIALCVPFFTLEISFLLFMKNAGAPSFFDWYGRHLQPEYVESYYKLTLFIGTEVSSFHVSFLFILLAIYFAFKNKEILSRKFLSKFIPLFIAVLPVLAWPIFISRVLYSQLLFVYPLSLYGIYQLSLRIGDKKILNIKIVNMLLILPIIFSVILYLVSKNNSIFYLVKDLF